MTTLIPKYEYPATGAVNRAINLKLQESVSVLDFGADPTGVADSTTAIQNAWNALKTTGGTLLFPSGTYNFYLDISGTSFTNVVNFVGEGTVICRPYTSTPTQSCVIYANNNPGDATSGFMKSVFVTFSNMTFTGRIPGSTSTGDVNYAVNLTYSSAHFDSCHFQYGKIASFYSLFGQYNEFSYCWFESSLATSSSVGCWLNSNGVNEAANENTFIRCHFVNNSIGLQINGGICNRLYGCQIQINQQKGVYLDADSTGFGNEGTLISGCYFEQATYPYDLYIGVSVGLLVEGSSFISTGTQIYSTNSLYLNFVGNTSYSGTTANFNHPSSATNIASVTWIGNQNFTVNLVNQLLHNGPTYSNVDNPNVNLVDNLVQYGQAEPAGVQTVYIPDWAGVKANVAKSTTTPIFSITQQTVIGGSLRVAVFTLEIKSWDDYNSGSQFGYSGHAQKYTCYIGNTNGTITASVTAESTGTDYGVNTSLQAPGPITITSSVVGQVITFSANWAGTGSQVSSMTTQAIGYVLKGQGTNAFYLTRL